MEIFGLGSVTSYLKYNCVENPEKLKSILGAPVEKLSHHPPSGFDGCCSPSNLGQK